MKKILILFLSSIMFISSVCAKKIDYEEFNDTGIIHAYIVGDYIFDLSYGYSPSLRDFMIASRSIPESEDVYLYEIDNVLIFDTYRKRSIYDNVISENKNEFGTFNIKYIYRNNIINASEKDYDIL